MSRFVKEDGLPSMLLVEGSEDAEVVGAIMKSHEIQPAFDVSVVVGISQLKQAFKIRLRTPTYCVNYGLSWMQTLTAMLYGKCFVIV